MWVPHIIFSVVTENSNIYFGELFIVPIISPKPAPSPYPNLNYCQFVWLLWSWCHSVLPYLFFFYITIIMKLFCSIPLIFLVQSWALRTLLISKLEVFLHRSVRSILGITITEVKEEIIRNAEVRGSPPYQTKLQNANLPSLER